ncbi:MAG TPA: ABC transporter permease [Thermoanaerobaculia bacterium]|nr:ABC transporter permease [Thermoanaerobaculia bacterium]
MFQDFRFGLRLWSRRPGFVLAAVVTLALGLGGATALFSVINGVFLSPLPYPEPDRLVMVWEKVVPAGMLQVPASYPNFADWRDQAKSFESLAAIDQEVATITGPQGPERVRASLVSSPIFGILRLKPALGSFFTAAEDRPDGSLVAVLSHEFWQRRFGGDPRIVGKTLTVDGFPVVVAGVLPQDFHAPMGMLRTDLWVPLQLFVGERSQKREDGFLGVMGRLKAGVSLSQARAEMDGLASQLEKAYPKANESHGITLITLQDQIFGRYRLLLLMLMAAVGFLLLISCTNVANLLLARAAERSAEIAIRSTLGADRRRLVRQMLVESVLLAGFGAALGLLFAVVAKDLLVKLGFEALPVSGEITIDGRVLLFTLLVSILTGIAFGLVPALRASSPHLTAVLKEGGRSTDSLGRSRGRKALVAFEVAMALILLVGAGLMANSLFRLQKVDLGFNPDHLVTLDVSLPAAKYSSPERQLSFFERAVERVEGLPGVERAAWVSHPPLTKRSTSSSFHIDGRPALGPSDLASAAFRGVSKGYFEALRIPLLGGRIFGPSDTASSPLVAVIDAASARQYWPGENPVGKRISLEGPQGPWVLIVGQVGSVRYAAPGEEERPTIYYDIAQMPGDTMTLVARAANDPAAAVQAIQREIQGLDPDQPVENVGTMEQIFASLLQGPKATVLVLGVFALLALLLAGVGIYGVISQYVAQYTQEIGIRMALGAQRRDIFSLVLRQGMGAVLAGIAGGVLGALGLTQLITHLLFGVEPYDPVTFSAVALLLATVALLACSVPAVRAVRVEPVRAMRYD